jgi:hypothetical protein
VHGAQAAAEFGAIRHVRLSFCAYTVTLCPLSGGDAGELAESGVVRARARAGARVQGVACCATMAIFIGCLLAGESSSRCLARETEDDARSARSATTPCREQRACVVSTTVSLVVPIARL